MDRVSVALEPPEETEGKDADQEADQGQEDADPGDNIQEQVVDSIPMLQTTERAISH